MSRFLFATIPAVGHTLPGLPIAQALINRGHSVRWYTGAAFADRITVIGATFCPMTGDDSSLVGLDDFYPGRREQSGIRRLQFDMLYAFARPMRTSLADLQALLNTESADLVVGDTGFGAGPILAELGGPPFAAFGISVVGFPSRNLAPFGLGLPPSGNVWGQVRNRVLDQLARQVLFRPMTAAVNEIRGSLGLPPTNQIVFEYPLASTLYLQLSTPGFEYPRPDLPAVVRYVGPPRPVAEPGWREPSWWVDLMSSKGDDPLGPPQDVTVTLGEEPRPRGRPVVLVTQGTVATDADKPIRPSLTALAEEDMLVIAVTGGSDPAELGPLPANARVARYVPFAELLPHVDVFVTNGGFGGVQLALAEGVPVVAAGTTEDKLEVNARVAYAGVGLNLRTQTPSLQVLRAAVRKVLLDPSYARRAGELAAEIDAAGREDQAATLLEEVAGRTGASRQDRSADAV